MPPVLQIKTKHALLKKGPPLGRKGGVRVQMPNAQAKLTGRLTGVRARPAVHTAKVGL